MVTSDLDKRIEEVRHELEKTVAERDEAIYREEMLLQRVEFMSAWERNSPIGAEVLSSLNVAKECSYEKMRAVEQVQAKLRKLESERSNGNLANEGNPLNRNNDAHSAKMDMEATREDANTGNPLSNPSGHHGERFSANAFGRHEDNGMNR